MRRALWTLCVCAVLFLPAGRGVAAEESAQPLTVTEFEQQAAPLAGQPTKAYRLLELSNAALAHGAEDNPAYAALAHGYKSHAFWLRNDYARAEREAREAISAAPDAALPYFFLADALNALLRYDDAYLACLHGADRRIEATRRNEARERCRDAYVTRVTLSPEEILRAVRDGKLVPPRLGNGKEQDSRRVFLSGKIAAIRCGQSGDELVFTASAGTVACRLAPLDPASMLTPVTVSESGKTSSPAAGLRNEQFVTVQGVLRQADDGTTMLEQCVVFKR